MKTINIKDIPTYKSKKVKQIKTNEKFEFNKARKIIHLACMNFDISYNQMTENINPIRVISEKKQIGAYLAKQMTNVSWTNLGYILKDNHSSIIYMFNRIESACIIEKELQIKIDSFKKYLHEAI